MRPEFTRAASVVASFQASLSLNNARPANRPGVGYICACIWLGTKKLESLGLFCIE